MNLYQCYLSSHLGHLSHTLSTHCHLLEWGKRGQLCLFRRRHIAPEGALVNLLNRPPLLQIIQHPLQHLTKVPSSKQGYRLPVQPVADYFAQHRPCRQFVQDRAEAVDVALDIVARPMGHHAPSLGARVLLCAKELVPGQIVPTAAESEIAQKALAVLVQDVGRLDVLVTVPVHVQDLHAVNDGPHDGPDFVDREDVSQDARGGRELKLELGLFAQGGLGKCGGTGAALLNFFGQVAVRLFEDEVVVLVGGDDVQQWNDSHLGQ